MLLTCDPSGAIFIVQLVLILKLGYPKKVATPSLRTAVVLKRKFVHWTLTIKYFFFKLHTQKLLQGVAELVILCRNVIP